MSFANPSKTTILIHEFFWFKVMKGYYRNFVNSLELKGDEKVLDFGCGPGAASKFIALKPGHFPNAYSRLEIKPVCENGYSSFTYVSNPQSINRNPALYHENYLAVKYTSRGEVTQSGFLSLQWIVWGFVPVSIYGYLVTLRDLPCEWKYNLHSQDLKRLYHIE